MYDICKTEILLSRIDILFLKCVDFDDEATMNELNGLRELVYLQGADYETILAALSKLEDRYRK